MAFSLAVSALSVTRGGRALFSELSFEARAGDLVAVRGANGAGKTTLLRVVAGYLQPQAGAVRLGGVEDAGETLHFLGHLNGLKSQASPASHVRYWAGLLGGDAEGALGRVGLAAQRDLPVRVLSQGQKRRLALARLIAAPRPLWLLDEPAAALDAAGRDMLDGLIKAHCAEGGIVFAALHEPLGVAPAQTITIGHA